MTVVNLTSLTGRDVYTRNAKYVGKVEDTMLDTEKGSVYGFAVSMARNSFLFRNVSKGDSGVKKTILIPYREVLACDDIVIVTVPKKYEEKPATEQTQEESFLPGIGENE